MILDFTPVQKTVFTYVVSSSTNVLEQKKSFYMRKEFHRHRTFVVHRHNRHFIVLHTNMAAVTSCKNDLLLSYS